MEEELECPICGEVFKQVVETPCCSRLFCRSCAEAWIAKSGSCASCREQITAEQLKPNKPFQRIVDNLPIKCPHSESGCTDKLTRGCIADHLVKCEYATVECPQWKECGTLLRKQLPEHLQNSCPGRQVACEDCQERIALYTLEEHSQRDCPEGAVSCPLCDEKLVRKDLKGHEDVCPLVPISCGFERYGCTEKIPRGKYTEHIVEANEKHLEMVNEIMDIKEKQHKALKDKMSAVKKDLVYYQEGVANLSILKPDLPFCIMKDEAVLLPSFLIKEPSHNEFTLDQTNRRVSYNAGLFPQFGRVRALIVRSDVPVPHSPNFYYFEITVESTGGKEPAIGLGFCPANHTWGGMPGWSGGSFGYHGDDGRIFSDKTGGRGEPYGPTWGKDDVVGCGMHQDSGKIFYTKNGTFLGFAFQEADRHVPYHAVIGVHANGVRVIVNFGRTEFKYRLDRLREWTKPLIDMPRAGEKEAAIVVGEGEKEKEL